MKILFLNHTNTLYDLELKGCNPDPDVIKNTLI